MGKGERLEMKAFRDGTAIQCTNQLMQTVGPLELRGRLCTQIGFSTQGEDTYV